MLLVIGAVLALQGTTRVPPPRRVPPTIVRDSTPPNAGPRNAGRRLAVTPALLASAFADAPTRSLFNLARRARVTQDSSITSYDVKAIQRQSIWMGIGKNGRERLAYRTETASRVQWMAGVGAWVDLTGARVAVPMVTDQQSDDAFRGEIRNSDLTPIPYYPGYESLWFGGWEGAESARTDVDDRTFVNPLGEGAEAYYTYKAGDSTQLRLGGGDGRPPSVFTIREVAFRPREPKWNLAVGSLWFDTRTGQLVRAAYRLSMTVELWTAVSDNVRERGEQQPPGIVQAIASPLEMHVSAVAIEYALVEGRYWMPRLRVMSGSGQVLFMKLPIEVETLFRYEGVNRLASLEPIPLPPPPVQVQLALPPRLDSAARVRWRDSVTAARAAATRAAADSVARRLKDPPLNSRDSQRRQCERGPSYVRTGFRYDVRLRVGLRILCDVEALRNSPDLPPSIYASSDSVFRSDARIELLNAATKFAAQAPFSLRTMVGPRYSYSYRLMRYNRVEGVSAALTVDQELGGGYAAAALLRLGAADLEPNGELSLSRTNMNTTVRVGGYHRLVSAGDWGDPLSFGSSVSALLFGRDEGFYFRTTGVELTHTTEHGWPLELRVFGERQRTAVPEATFTLGSDFQPNIVSTEGMFVGAAARLTHSAGENPQGFRLLTDIRAEGAGGDARFGRAAADFTLSRGLARRLAAALTVAGGTSVGDLPPQRRWYLGGTQTIRGQRPDTASGGTAFWLGRVEIGTGQAAMRQVIFGDIGWAGDRTRLTEVGRPMSGAGLGWSFFDGVIRFDVSKGLYPGRGVRLDAYFDARF
jgi:hypothetical protein